VVNLDDLEVAARRKGIADLRDVQLAVLEPERSRLCARRQLDRR
jgi:hypothetical protein